MGSMSMSMGSMGGNKGRSMGSMGGSMSGGGKGGGKGGSKGMTTPTAAPTDGPTTAFPTVSRDRLNEIITCIAVIDEADNQSPSIFQTLWTQFRMDYPERPCCLLQPEPNPPSNLFIPQAFLDDDNTIFQLSAVEVEASDWFDICDLAGLRAQGVVDVAIFIDDSGSLTVPQVAASNALLIERLDEEGLNLVAGISNTAEDWIGPFLPDFN